MLRHGPLSRAELARRTGLSQGSLTRLTKPLLAGGILVEADDPPRSDQVVGRPARPSTSTRGTPSSRA
ncbi:helix-turn-helix domain-containing protein [Oerskovia sp. M15]